MTKDKEVPKRPGANVDSGKEVSLWDSIKDLFSKKSLADEVKEAEELVERSRKQRGSK